MTRTQISLNPDELSWLRREAKLRQTSLAGVVRQLVQEAAQTAESGTGPKKPRRRASGRKHRRPWVGMCKDAPPTDAQLTDDYLYAEGEAL